MGSPESRCRPRTSIVSSGLSAVAEPIAILIVSAVREPIDPFLILLAGCAVASVLSRAATRFASPAWSWIGADDG